MDSTILDESREPLKLPAFEKAAMQSVTRALEVWRDEAMQSGFPASSYMLAEILMLYRGAAHLALAEHGQGSPMDGLCSAFLNAL